MHIENARVFIGPIMQLANTLAIFLCLRPKRGMLFSVGTTVAYALMVHGILQLVLRLFGLPDIFAGSLIGMLFLPLDIWLFKGRTFQITFAFFITFQFNGLMAAVAEMLVGEIVGFHNDYAQEILLVLALLLLGLEMLALRLYGRRLFVRIFVDGGHLNWGLYSLGAVFSSVLVSLLQWQVLGGAMYTALVLFILLGIALSCYAIINTHEKAEQALLSESLLIQMDAMREQTEAEKLHRAALQILRHDMRHEAGVIMELYREGKAAESEAVFAEWMNSLNGAAPEKACDAVLVSGGERDKY